MGIDRIFFSFLSVLELKNNIGIDLDRIDELRKG